MDDSPTAIPTPILKQLVKANISLDIAELIAIRDVKERCIAQATKAQDTVAHWLRSGACPGDEVGLVEDALRDLADRLVVQSSADNERRE